MHLNTNSQLHVAYSTSARQVRLLQGEAHFKVAENADAPFRVQAGSEWVEAVGTAFAVHLSENGVDVTVTEGRVKLSRTAAGADAATTTVDAATGGHVMPVEQSALGMLEAGQRAVIVQEDSNVSGSVSIDAADVDRELAWRDGVLLFTGEPLDVVVREISRYTTMQIEIADPSIRALPVGGRFPIGETDAMFYALETNFGLAVMRASPDRAVISAASE